MRYRINARYTISIHALLAESDHFDGLSALAPEQFLSTLSLRRATWSASKLAGISDISIHALLAESDSYCACRTRNACISIHALLAESDVTPPSYKLRIYHFYPRSPCGERPPKVLRHCTTYLFLSTLSLRRATRESDTEERSQDISIHALLAESDARCRYWA